MGGFAVGEFVFLLLVVVVVVFLVCRDIVCWYWKLNKIVYYQEYQRNLLQLILKELRSMNPNAVQIDPGNGDPDDVHLEGVETSGFQARATMPRTGVRKRRRPLMAIGKLIGKE